MALSLCLGWIAWKNIHRRFSDELNSFVPPVKPFTIRRHILLSLSRITSYSKSKFRTATFWNIPREPYNINPVGQLLFILSILQIFISHISLTITIVTVALQLELISSLILSEFGCDVFNYSLIYFNISLSIFGMINDKPNIQVMDINQYI